MPGGESAADVEVQGASAASFSAPMQVISAEWKILIRKWKSGRHMLSVWKPVFRSEQCSEREKGSQFALTDWWEDVCFVKESNRFTD